MKRDTKRKHIQLANDTLYYIYKHIDTDINIDTLCQNIGVSRFHLQRVFKEQFGMNIYESIKSIRLQKASSLLITNQDSTITQIANICGYSSQSSFIRVFKERFNMTPTSWRRGGYIEFSKSILASSMSASISEASFENIEIKIVKQPDIKAYYIRHRGYSYKIKEEWQKIQAWVYSHSVDNYKFIGIYHDNPLITPLDECYYIASVSTQQDIEDTYLPIFTIPNGLYARFDVSGKYGDILKFIEWVYHNWLPNSGFETTTLPSYTIFNKNHFLNESQEFEVEYYLPIKLA